MYYAQYNQVTDFDFETEYIFCKDNRLVLIVECLFKRLALLSFWSSAFFSMSNRQKNLH